MKINFITIIGFFILLIFNLYSCNEKNNDLKIARVGNEYLLRNDIINEIPLNLSTEDSIVMVENIIHQWLVDKLIVGKAKEMIPSEVINVDRKINKYKMSLISYEFEQFYINKRLDTNINTFEIVDYYNNHLDDFVLNDYIVKCVYVKVPKNAAHLKDLKKCFYIKSESQIDQLRSLTQKNATIFYYNPDEWIYYNDLLKQVPLIEKYTKINFIKQKKKVILEKDEDVYLVNIYDYKIKDGTSPLSFEKEKIKSILLNQRANTLRKKLRTDLYDDGIKNKLIEKY